MQLRLTGFGCNLNDVGQNFQDDEASKYAFTQRLEELFVGELHLAELRGVEGFSKQVSVWHIRPDLCRMAQSRQMLLEDLTRAAKLSAYSASQILDVWQTNDAIALATEYLSGLTLRQALRESSALGVPFPSSAAIAVALEVSRALEDAHNPHSFAGTFAHGDIRPELVILGHEGTIKLTGFGFGRFLPASSPDGAWATWGDHCYQPPERRSGEAPSAANDLYSLGLLLLETVSFSVRQVPTDPLAIVERTRPLNSEALTRLTGIEEDIAEVVCHACSPDPSRRYSEAGEMAADLLGLLLERRETSSTMLLVRRALDTLTAPFIEEDEDQTIRANPRETAFELGADDITETNEAGASSENYRESRPTRPPRFEAPTLQMAKESPVFFGRQDVLREIAKALVESRRGQGRVVLVAGPGGIGRTHVLSEVAFRLSEAERSVSWVQIIGDAKERGARYASVLRLLASTIGIRPDDEVGRLAEEEQRLRALGLENESISAIRTALGVEREHQTEPARLAGLLSEAAIRAVSRLGWEQTTIVAWDDLQWADDASLGCLYEMLSRLATLPVLVLLTANDDFELPWSLPTGSVELQLGPLTPAESGKLVTAIVGEARYVNPPLLTALLENTQGVPRQIVESVELLLELDRLEVRDEEVYLKGDPHSPLPTLEDTLRRRLTLLDDETRAIAVTAAVAGPALSPNIIAETTGLPLDTVEHYIVALAEEHGLLRRTPSGFTFRREGLRETVMASAKSGVLKAIRKLLAKSLLRDEAGQIGNLARRDHAAQLYIELGDEQTAAAVLQESAQGQEARGDLLGASERYSRALELSRTTLPPEQELALCMALGRTAVHALDADLGEQALLGAIAISEELDDPKAGTEARLLLCRLLTQQGRFESAIERTREAMPLAEQTGDEVMVAKVCGAVAESFQQWGEYGPDIAYIERALQIAGDEGDLKELGRYLHLAVMHAVGVGEYDRTRELLDRARAIARASNDPVLTCQLLKAEGLMLFFSGDHEGALKVNLEGVALAHGYGLAEPEIIMLHNCGDAYLILDRDREALYFYNESLRRARLARFDRLAETNELYLGFLEARHLGLEEGFQRLKTALDNANRVNRVWNMTQGNLLVGRLYLERGDLNQALSHLNEAAALARKSGVRYFVQLTEHWIERAEARGREHSH